MNRYLKRHEAILAAILVLSLIGLGYLNNRFLTLDNLLNQGRLMTEIGLIALPMTFVIVTWEFDLSVARTLGISSVTLGLLVQAHVPIVVAMLVCLLCGLVAGAINGFLVTVI